jgi:integrase
MASVRLKGKGRWEARWYTVDPATGARARRSKIIHAAGEDAAVREAYRLENADRDEARPADRTVLEAVEAWLEHGGRRGSEGSSVVIRDRARLYLAPDPLAAMPVAQVTVDDLEAYYGRLRRRRVRGGGTMAEQSVRHCHWDLSGALALAERRGWRKGNPARAVELPAQQVRDVEPPEPENLALLLKTIDELAGRSWPNVELAVAARLAASTGARAGEVCALRWQDVDLEAGTVRLARSQPRAGRGDGVKDTKAHTRRTVALPAGVVEALAAHRARVEDVLGVPARR